MNTKQIADRLVALCREGKFTQAQTELYAQDATSTEVEGAPQDGPLGNVKGLDAILAKGAAFEDTYTEMHGITVSDPLVAADWFTLTMGMDATWKRGGRMAMEEICVYRVRDGKIDREQFFYSMG